MWQVNWDVSNTTIHPDLSRTLKNGHDSTHGATKNEPDSATVEQDLGHAHNPPRFTTNVLNGLKLS